MEHSTDIAVIGGGMLGSAIAYGLASRGARVSLLDEGDGALRAARVNFGLVWLHVKGDGRPAYSRWTRQAADRWPAFAQELKEVSGVDVHYAKTGGVNYCLGEADYDKRAKQLESMRGQSGDYPNGTELIDRTQLAALLPGLRLGPDVLGASYCKHDGAVDPLRLLRAMHTAMVRRGVIHHPECRVEHVRAAPGGGFELDTAAGTIGAGRVVLAAGHGIGPLMSDLGFDFPMRPERGQIIVTERVAPVLPLPANGVRQMREGTFLIGTTQEDVGFDDATTPDAGAGMAAKMIRVLPDLARLKIVRTWAGLRVMTGDNYPVYEQSQSYPGAFVATCHSGVTLASVHASTLAESILAGDLQPAHHDFHSRRFHVPNPA